MNSLCIRFDFNPSFAFLKYKFKRLLQVLKAKSLLLVLHIYLFKI